MLHSITVWFLQCLGFDPRGIFSFHDGRRYRHVDPIEVARRLWAVTIEQQPFQQMPGLPRVAGMEAPPLPFDANSARRLIASGNGEEVQQGYSEMAQAARQAFLVKSYDEGGLTELECANLIDRFELYLGDVKKNASGSPISSASTGSTKKSPTSSESGSGSTSIDSSSAPREPSDSAPL